MATVRKTLVLLVLIVGVMGIGVASGVFGIRGLKLPIGQIQQVQNNILTEESVTINVVKKVTPSVVTVAITGSKLNSGSMFNFGPFGFWEQPSIQNQEQTTQDIGSGFIIKSDGLIVTNKHVVSDTTAKYKIITSDNKTYEVEKIYRDPNNDLALLKISTTGLTTVELGDSDNLQVGQFAIAIGTALGEFRSTVTTGVISGIGRSITAGTPFMGSEQLNNIIQTSAPINSGNSGGPLLNSSGQVIGVNVAMASGAQNIGFALPVNVLKSQINVFETTGGFPSKPFLGIQYQLITQNAAIVAEVPQGAFVQSVVADSPADKAGVKNGDIITKIDNQNIKDVDGGLAAIISSKKVGDAITLTIYRDGDSTTVKAALTESSQ